MFKHLKLGVAVGALCALATGTSAHASLISQGITYDLEAQATADPLTERFALKITGENTASDTEGGINAGRSGINAIAFNEVSNGATASGVMLAPPTGFTFQTTGLDSSGCKTNTGPNFYCFDNTAIPPTPSGSLSGPLIFVFEVTLKPGNTWVGYDPDFKIDWVGTANNYDLVSKELKPDTTCPDCVINPVDVTPVPEPASLLVMGSSLAFLGGIGWIRRRRNGGEAAA